MRIILAIFAVSLLMAQSPNGRAPDQKVLTNYAFALYNQAMTHGRFEESLSANQRSLEAQVHMADEAVAILGRSICGPSKDFKFNGADSVCVPSKK